MRSFRAGCSSASTDAASLRHLVTFELATACRVCGSADSDPVIDLGATPLANALVSPESAAREDPQFPLATVRCTECGLMRLTVVVDQTMLFGHYLYATSASPPMVDHFDGYAASIDSRFAVRGALVVEVGSNDGMLLRSLRDRGVRALGIEPAANLARVANEAGLPTVNAFFNAETGRRVRAEHGKAAAVLANNVLAHIDDLGGVLDGFDALVADDGVIVIEVPYLLDLLDHVEYDTIYHEHLSYFSGEALRRLFERGGFDLFDIERVPVHGGSLRAFAGRRGRRRPHERVEHLLAGERAAGLDSARPFRTFAERVVRSRTELVDMIRGFRQAGDRVAALGATAKGNTLLNYCGLDSEDVEFVADSTPMKQGLLTPGSRIPVRPESALLTERPEHTLLLAWNYAQEILARFGAYTAAGGQFIHPIPVARILR